MTFQTIYGVLLIGLCLMIPNCFPHQTGRLRELFGFYIDKQVKIFTVVGKCQEPPRVVDTDLGGGWLGHMRGYQCDA